MNHNTSPKRVIAFELNGTDTDIFIVGLEKLLKRAKSLGVESFKYAEPEAIEGEIPVVDNNGQRIGEQPIICGYVEVHVGPQPIRNRVIKRLNTEGPRSFSTPYRKESQLDFASLLAESEVYDIGRVQPPKGGRFVHGSRFVQQTGIIFDTDGRKKHIFIRAGTSIPVEADGTKGAEVLRVYAAIQRMSDNKFVRYAERKEIAIAFPKFMFLLAFVGKHVEGIKEIEDFIPLRPTDEELLKAGIKPEVYGL